MTVLQVPTIPIKDLDLETLLAVAERTTPTGNVVVLRSADGWSASFDLLNNVNDVTHYPTPEEALVALVTPQRP